MNTSPSIAWKSLKIDVICLIGDFFADVNLLLRHGAVNSTFDVKHHFGKR